MNADAMSHPQALLVTGANGFVGRAVCKRLAIDGRSWVGATRTGEPVAGCPTQAIGEIGPDTRWESALRGCDGVIHLAARVHVMNERSADPLAEFRRVNVQGSVALARAAAAAGVRRFVFVSSVKVNGEQTLPGQPFRATDAPAPEDAYAISKFEAEQQLQALAQATGMELVIVRPPLVYGPGVGANFGALMRWIGRGRPLPLGALRNNRRSLVAVDNLVDLLVRCATDPAAPGHTFLAGDGEDLSTAELVERIGMALGRPARQLALPPWLLRGLARAIGRPAIASRLCDSLQVDISNTCKVLAWQPPVSVDEALARAAGGASHPALRP